MPYTKSGKLFAIYWIRLQGHTDMFSQGYIGVTGQGVDERYRQHLKNAASEDKRRSSPILAKAIRKHGKDNMIITTVVLGDRDYIYELERKLRPVDRIGWNTISGGNSSPVHSEEVRKKIGDSNRGKIRSAETRAKLSQIQIEKNSTRERKAKPVKVRNGIQLSKNKVLPWKHNKLSQSARELWKVADKLYRIWLLHDKPKSPTLARLHGIDTSVSGTPKTFRTLCRLFKEFNWNPEEDMDWIEWRENVE